jgi:hypothetical protein
MLLLLSMAIAMTLTGRVALKARAGTADLKKAAVSQAM